jgi:hypothetical protein
MASKTRAFPDQTLVPRTINPLHAKISQTPERTSAKVLESEIAGYRPTDLHLYHNAADGTWSNRLAECVRSERSGQRYFITHHDCLHLTSATDIMDEAEKFFRTSRFFGLVVSARMLQEDWPAFEKLLSALSELDLAGSRFVTILKENVTMPPLLRLQEWIDFRDVHRFEEGVWDLATLLREDLPGVEKSPRQQIGTGMGEITEPAWKIKPLFLGAKKVSERIVSNLFPLVEIPRDIFSAESQFRTESEITEACGVPGPLPFLLKGSRLYSVTALTENSVFGPALKEHSKPSQEHFAQWLSHSERAPWAIELLNHLLRYHAWKRGMRFDEGQSLFYFTRSKPKKIWWEISGKTIQREVTAPHTKWNKIDDKTMAEFQCGWKHEAIRAGFVSVAGALFLRLEPAWFLTELDGKTPSTNQPVGPLDSFQPNQERNVQALRALCFWSAIFAKGHRELRIETGTNPIRVRLSPASGSSHSVISNDQLDFDTLALTDIDHAQLIPELGPI